MRLPFRQGIVRYSQSGPVQTFLQVSGAYVNLLTDNGDVEITLAYKNSNYTYIENATVPNAWGPIDTSQTYWLYWDIDLHTAERTFGATQFEPIVSSAAPSQLGGQHWFDTNNNIMKVWNGTAWQEVIRVFAARLEASQFYSVGVGTSLPFAGTQVALEVSSLSGQIVYDEVGNPVKRSTNEFFTTEDQFFTSGARVNVTRLESGIEIVKAAESIAEYHVGAYDSSGEVRLANYDDTSETVLCMVVEDVVLGQDTTVVLQGVVSNVAWTWPTIGVPLWVLENGELVDADPFITDITSYPKQKVPVARVLGTDRVIFAQGLGGKGDEGPVGPSGIFAIPEATPVSLGIVTSTTSNSQVVSTDDPRMTDERVPLAHLHAGSDISNTPYGLISSSNVEGALQNLEDDKMSKTGSTMTGPLTLSGAPTVELHATTKQYVDSLVSGLKWIDPIHHVNLVADNITDPSSITKVVSDVYIVPLGAIGVWSGLIGKMVLWDGASWVDLGLVSDHPAGLRFGVAFETTTVPTGSFASQKNNIAVLVDPSLQTWAFETPIAANAVYVNNEESLHKYHQYVYESVSPSWIEFGGPSAPTDHNHIVKETLSFFIGNDMIADTIVGFFIAPQEVVFDTDAPGSIAECETPVGGGDPDVVYDLQKNGVSVGTVTFSALATVGVIVMTATTLNIGDKLQIKTQLVADANHRDVSISLVGCATMLPC